jgi:phosphatidylserine decarboxylase
MTVWAGDFARRVGGRIGIAPEGVTMAAGVLAAGVLVLVLGWHLVGLLVILCGLAVAAFFRDPERSPASCSERQVLSAADGTVSDVVEMPLPEGGTSDRYHRVSVFMSPLNVHVNRAPVSGEVISVRHTPGSFHAAFRDFASEQNERNLIVLRDVRGRQHAIVQIAGYLARRIVCRISPHDTVRCGDRIGLIMFGSRVDHFIPPDYRVMVKIGEHVRAGESIIGEVPQ